MTAQAEERLDAGLLKVAGVLVLGALAPLLDSTIVNVAIHTLGSELHASVAAVQWVSTAYLLALAMAVPITGWAATRFGAKRMWLIALALFLIGSVLCGLAWNLGALVAFRVIQGIGGGLMLPILQTIIMRAAGGQRIGRLMAVITLPALIGPILGPVLGAVMLDQLSWHWIFYVNVPICLAAIILAWRTLPRDAETRAGALDIRGLLLVSPALAGIFYGLSQDSGHHQTAVLLPLGLGIALLAIFVIRAVQIDHPLIDLRLFKNRSFAASSGLLFLAGFGLFGAMLILPLYFQQSRGATVIAAGLLLAPQGLGSLLARAAGSLSDRLGPKPIVLAGIALTAIGTIPFAIDGTSYLLLGCALVVRGAGLSAINLSVMVGAFRELRPEQIPHASSTTRIMQQLGGSFGAAVLAVILQRELRGHPTGAAFAHTFWWAIGFTVLSIVPAVALPRVRGGLLNK